MAMIVSGRPVVTCHARSAEIPLAPVVVRTLSFVLSRFHWPVGPLHEVAGGHVAAGKSGSSGGVVGKLASARLAITRTKAIPGTTRYGRTFGIGLSSQPGSLQPRRLRLRSPTRNVGTSREKRRGLPHKESACGLASLKPDGTGRAGVSAWWDARGVLIT